MPFLRIQHTEEREKLRGMFILRKKQQHFLSFDLTNKLSLYFLFSSA